MASPFSYFRKHMKAMLALLTVLVMGGFVVLPILMKSMSGGGGRTDSVVVSTDRYGSLRESDIDWLRRDRSTMQAFLRQVAARVTPDPRYAGMTSAGMFMRIIGPSDEEDVVNTWLLARHAEDLGLLVTDEAVEAFLKQLVEGKLDGEEIEMILGGLDISVDTFYRMLRHELLAYHTQQLFQASVAGSTPAERWGYYQRLNRKIAIEAIRLPVNEFVSADSVSDRTLKELFEKHKNEEPNPSSPKPGFRVPVKIAVEYFKADYEHLVERAEISESEIQEYYEEHKAQLFKRTKLPDLDPETETRSMSVPALDDGVESLPGLWENGKYALPREKKPEPQPKTDTSQEPAPADQPKKPAPEQKPAPADQAKKPTPEEKPPAKESPPTKPSGPEIPTGGENKPKADPESNSPGDSSKLQPASPFRLVSLAQEEAGQTTPEKPEGEKPTTKKTPDEMPDDAKSAPGDKSIDEVVDSIVGEKSPPEESEFEPLEEVEEQIKRTLAIEKLQETLAVLQSKMSAYRTKIIPYKADLEDGNTEAQEPNKLDFAKLAKENGLAAYKTNLIPAYESQDLDIGKSTIDGSRNFQTAAFETIAEWRPVISQDDDGNYYLFWIREKTEGRVPEFGDPGIRDQVEMTWKMIQARVPATEEAGRLVAEALKADQEKSLKDIFPDRTVIETEPFSWMTYGAYPMWMAQAPPSVSDITPKTPEGATEPETGDAIEAPGSRFMRDVSVLDKGQIGVATNQPETDVYVVRVTDVSPLPEVLWQMFLADDYGRYSMVSDGDRGELRQAWYEAIKASAEFEWSGRAPRRR